MDIDSKKLKNCENCKYENDCNKCITLIKENFEIETIVLNNCSNFELKDN